MQLIPPRRQTRHQDNQRQLLSLLRISPSLLQTHPLMRVWLRRRQSSAAPLPGPHAARLLLRPIPHRHPAPAGSLRHQRRIFRPLGKLSRLPLARSRSPWPRHRAAGRNDLRARRACSTWRALRPRTSRTARGHNSASICRLTPQNPRPRWRRNFSSARRARRSRRRASCAPSATGTSSQWRSHSCVAATTPSAATAYSTGLSRKRNARCATRPSRTCGSTRCLMARSTTTSSKRASIYSIAPAGSVRLLSQSSLRSLRRRTTTITTRCCSTCTAGGATSRTTRRTTMAYTRGSLGHGFGGEQSATACGARAESCKVDGVPQGRRRSRPPTRRPRASARPRAAARRPRRVAPSTWAVRTVPAVTRVRRRSRLRSWHRRSRRGTDGESSRAEIERGGFVWPCTRVWVETRPEPSMR
mmetsp:Transcript_12257/g.26502  ORF Transcript_12257/g.26502 Transcript_12257/m.26502 type:complete len:415 (+) Transcript_12257:536-1780(+)